MTSTHRLTPWILAAALLSAAPAAAKDPPPAQTPDRKAPEVVPAEDPGGLRRDPVEKDPRYADVFARIDAEVDAQLRDHPRRGSEGFCHVVWQTKKRLLQDKYGIDWRSPDEMNPQVIFD